MYDLNIQSVELSFSHVPDNHQINALLVKSCVTRSRQGRSSCHLNRMPLKGYDTQAIIINAGAEKYSLGWNSRKYLSLKFRLKSLT